MVDKNGKTSINNLFSCGESSRTGLHGANRLASNSLLEALVYAHNIYTYLITKESNAAFQEIPEWNEKRVTITKDHILIQYNLKELQTLMRNYAGIVRNNNQLNEAKNLLDIIYKEIDELYQTVKINTPLCELRNMINVAHLIINDSLIRNNNKGGYYNIDNLKPHHEPTN